MRYLMSDGVVFLVLSGAVVFGCGSLLLTLMTCLRSIASLVNIVTVMDRRLADIQRRALATDEIKTMNVSDSSE